MWLHKSHTYNLTQHGGTGNIPFILNLNSNERVHVYNLSV